MNVAKLSDYFHKDLGWGYGYQDDIIFDFLCRASRAAKDGVILDVGAGHQRYRPFFEDALYLAQEHPIAGVQNKGIHRYDILSDARIIPLVDGCVDVVLSTVSFEHMEYPNDFLAESVRVLKPGGSLYLQAPFIYHEHEVPYDFQRLTRYGMRRDVEAAGYGDIRIAPTSSSTRCAIEMLNYALNEDARLTPRHTMRRFFRKRTCRMLRPMLGLICFMFDQGPHEETRFPVCWVVTAVKPGRKLQTSSHISSANAFLRRHALRHENVVFEDDALIWRPNNTPGRSLGRCA